MQILSLLGHVYTAQCSFVKGRKTGIGASRIILASVLELILQAVSYEAPYGHIVAFTFGLLKEVGEV